MDSLKCATKPRMLPNNLRQVLNPDYLVGYSERSCIPYLHTYTGISEREIAGVTVVWSIIDAISVVNKINTPKIQYKLSQIYQEFTNIVYGSNHQI